MRVFNEPLRIIAPKCRFFAEATIRAKLSNDKALAADAARGEVGAEMEIEILGERYAAKVIPDSPHAPENKRLRG